MKKLTEEEKIARFVLRYVKRNWHKHGEGADAYFMGYLWTQLECIASTSITPPWEDEDQTS